MLTVLHQTMHDVVTHARIRPSAETADQPVSLHQLVLSPLFHYHQRVNVPIYHGDQQLIHPLAMPFGSHWQHGSWTAVATPMVERARHTSTDPGRQSHPSGSPPAHTRRPQNTQRPILVIDNKRRLASIRQIRRLARGRDPPASNRPRLPHRQPTNQVR